MRRRPRIPMPPGYQATEWPLTEEDWERLREGFRGFRPVILEGDSTPLARPSADPVVIELEPSPWPFVAIVAVLLAALIVASLVCS